MKISIHSRDCFLRCGPALCLMFVLNVILNLLMHTPVLPPPPAPTPPLPIQLSLSLSPRRRIMPHWCIFLTRPLIQPRSITPACIRHGVRHSVRHYDVITARLSCLSRLRSAGYLSWRVAPLHSSVLSHPFDGGDQSTTSQ